MMHVIVRDNLHDQDYIARHTLGFDKLQIRLAEYPTTAVGGENYIDTVWGRGYVLRDRQTAETPSRKRA